MSVVVNAATANAISAPNAINPNIISIYWSSAYLLPEFDSANDSSCGNADAYQQDSSRR